MDNKRDKYDSDFESNKQSKHKGFFSFVFEYNEEKKEKLLKIGQYISLGFIFYSIFLHIINNYFPTIDETSSSIEILITLLLYLYVFFYSVYYIDRIICYSHTIFGVSNTSCYLNENNEIPIFNIVTPALLSILSFNTQFQDGLRIIFERATDAWNGTEKKQKKKNKNNQQQQAQQAIPPQQHMPITSSLYSGNATPINQLPILQEGFTQQQQQPMLEQQMQHQMPVQHQMQQLSEPMAANEGIGSAFGTLF
jgi:hypothetical protein